MLKKLLWAVCFLTLLNIVQHTAYNILPERNSSGAAMARTGDSSGEYIKISPERAKALMESSNPYILLDVRTEAEYTAQHIEGALLLPDFELKDRAALMLPEKDTLILVYCRTGRRSARAARLLLQMGYKQVLDFGGIIDWPYATIGK